MKGVSPCSALLFAVGWGCGAVEGFLSAFSRTALNRPSPTARFSSTETSSTVENTLTTTSDAPPPPRATSSRSLTERIMRGIESENQVGGAGGASTWEAFQRAEANWSRLRAFRPFEYDAEAAMGGPDPTSGVEGPPQFVTTDALVGRPQVWEKLRESKGKELDFDVVVCGGTLGIFFTTALQLKGHSVCVLEAGKLQGREQEWNMSMDELMELVELGVLTEDDLDAAIRTEFPGCRSGFKNKEVTPLSGGYFDNGVGYECVTADVLNLGVSPAVLVERVSKRFAELGGVIKENTRLQGVAVSDLVGAGVGRK